MVGVWGMFEPMVKSTNRCLKKTVGRACLTFEELTEIEAVLNSRPLSYVSTEELEEPLTPFHLLTGFQVLSLLDPTLTDPADDPDSLQSVNEVTHRMKHLIRTSEGF